MSRPVSIAALATAVALALAGAAYATSTHHATTIDAAGTSPSGASKGTFIEYGRVHSANPRCRSHRTMTMIAHYPDGSTKVVDTTVSSRNGAYAMVGNFTGSDRALIRAAVKRYGPKDNRHVCDAGQVPAD